MHKVEKTKLMFAVIVLLCGLTSAEREISINQSSIAPKDVRNRLQMDFDFSKIDLYFIRNRGQVHQDAFYYAKASRYTLWLTRQGLVFDSLKLLKEPTPKGPGALDPGITRLSAHPQERKTRFKRDVTRLEFKNANPRPVVVPYEKAGFRINYFKGNDPGEWSSDVPTFKGVVYRSLYKGIDLKVHGVEKELEYDWVVQPHADPLRIRFAYRNVKGTRIDNEGNLVIQTAFGDMIHKKPVAFQEMTEGSPQVSSICKKTEVDVHFKSYGENTYGFVVGRYDPDRELVIDPLVLVYSSYLGGAGPDYGLRIAVDDDGFVYVTGTTSSTDYPTKNPYQEDQINVDTFITKMDPGKSGTDSLIYSSYLGGHGNDWAGDIAVDANGYAYLTGTTFSTNFPFLNQYMLDPGDSSSDVFVVKVDTNASGVSSLVYSTYLGGDGPDAGKSIAIDDNGHAYVTGATGSSDYPLLNYCQGYQAGDNAFVTKLNTNTSGTPCLVYSTYLGGGSDENGFGIAVDQNKHAYITGKTGSIDFPTLNEIQGDQSRDDVFVARIDTKGSGVSSLIYSTYLGGNGIDTGISIDVDDNGHAYVTGVTTSTNFPTINPYMGDPGDSQDDAFLARINTNISGPSGLVYSTYLGGSANDYGYSIVVDDSGHAYVAGETLSSDFPTLDHYMADPGDSTYDGFIAKIDTGASGIPSLSFSTYFGGNSYDACSGIAIDERGCVFVTGRTSSSDFPIRNAYMSDPGGGDDAFVAQLCFPRIDVSSPNGGEIWQSGSQQLITWEKVGSFSFVKIEYSLDNGFNWNNIIVATVNDGSYEWTIPGVVSTQCLVRVSDAEDGDPKDVSDGVFSIFGAAAPPEFSLNRSQLNFGAESGTHTQSQDVLLSYVWESTLGWSVSDDQAWLSCTPTSGAGPGRITVSVDPTGLNVGSYNGTVTVTDPSAVNSPQTVAVTLKVYASGGSNAPFGSFATPADQSTVQSSISVSGWALDDVEVVSVKIYREAGENLVFIGDAVFVEGARPDLETSYPSYPLNYRGGWGYMLLTYGLPDQGMSATYTLHAIATDKEGNTTDLGNKTITCDNQHAVKPFGAIATPTQGGEASGEAFRNWGWALTPPPNMIPVDGSTLWVLVDGVPVGQPVYNIYRTDVAALFPDCLNSDGAGAYFDLDTREGNGVHTIAWVATDNAGNADGIGSRFFKIVNTSSYRAATIGGVQAILNADTIKDYLIENVPVRLSRNGNDPRRGREIHVDPLNGTIKIEMNVLSAIALDLNPDKRSGVTFTGYLRVAEDLRPLPIGSTLDTKNNLFYWQPAPGFYGEYDLVFVDTNHKLVKRICVIVK